MIVIFYVVKDIDLDIPKDNTVCKRQQAEKGREDFVLSKWGKDISVFDIPCAIHEAQLRIGLTYS